MDASQGARDAVTRARPRPTERTHASIMSPRRRHHAFTPEKTRANALYATTYERALERALEDVRRGRTPPPPPTKTTTTRRTDEEDEDADVAYVSSVAAAVAARDDGFDDGFDEDARRGVEEREFEFEQSKDSRIDWNAIYHADSAAIRRERDIDALESALEVVVRADIDSVTNQDMAEPRKGRELAKLSQLLVEYLLHVQEALSEGKCRAEKEAIGWRERARKERDECRKYARELRLLGEAHEAELMAVAAEYAKKRNAPDSAELEDARRRGESIASERAGKELERRLKEQRELFDSAVDRMRAAHAEAQAEAARELAARKAELAAARAEYVSNSADSTKEANRMVQDAQSLIRDAREKAELEKSNVARVRADLNAALESTARQQRALAENRLELTKMREDLKFEREANGELRKALERRDEERKQMREQIEKLLVKTKDAQDKEELIELTNMRELVKENYDKIEKLKRENEILRADKEKTSTWVEENKQKWISANEQILQGELASKEEELAARAKEISDLKALVIKERAKKIVTIQQREQKTSQTPPSESLTPAITRVPVAPVDVDTTAKAAVAPEPSVAPQETLPAKRAEPTKQRKKLSATPPPRDVEDMEGALNAMMKEIDVDMSRDDGLADDAFEAAMAKFEATRLHDVPKNLRERYMASRAEIQREIDGVVIGGVH
jgi:hypothetical protein